MTRKPSALRWPKQASQRCRDRFSISSTRGATASRCVGYRDIRFTKAAHVLRGMGLANLGKSNAAIAELAQKGMTPIEGEAKSKRGEDEPLRDGRSAAKHDWQAGFCGSASIAVILANCSLILRAREYRWSQPDASQSARQLGAPTGRAAAFRVVPLAPHSFNAFRGCRSLLSRCDTSGQRQDPTLKLVLVEPNQVQLPKASRGERRP
jgi:hypothetical protein